MAVTIAPLSGRGLRLRDTSRQRRFAQTGTVGYG
jgi:hypothetical protein